MARDVRPLVCGIVRYGAVFPILEDGPSEEWHYVQINMATYFPQLASGASTALPYRTVMAYDTLAGDVPSGQKYAFARRSSPLHHMPREIQTRSPYGHYPGEKSVVEQSEAPPVGRSDSRTPALLLHASQECVLYKLCHVA